MLESFFFLLISIHMKAEPTTPRLRYTIPVTFHVTAEQKTALMRASIASDLSVSHLVRRAVVKKILKNGKS